MRESFFQLCIIFSILVIIFTLSINFVSALGVFGDTTIDTGYDTVISDVGDDTYETSDSIFKQILPGLPNGVSDIWGTVMTAGGIISIGVAILMHSAIPIGVYIFFTVFWSSYIRCIGIINVDGIFTTAPLSGFLVIITVGMIILFMGALAGMFSGSG